MSLSLALFLSVSRTAQAPSCLSSTSFSHTHFSRSASGTPDHASLTLPLRVSQPQSSSTKCFHRSSHLARRRKDQVQLLEAKRMNPSKVRYISHKLTVKNPVAVRCSNLISFSQYAEAVLASGSLSVVYVGSSPGLCCSLWLGAGFSRTVNLRWFVSWLL